jgi:TRAP-type C4-dicarboxylate transport system permease small subunit
MAGGLAATGKVVGAGHRGLEWVARVFHIISVFGLLAIALLVCADVLSRGLFNRPVPGTAEMVANTLVGLLFLQLPFAVLSNSMIRATVVYDAVGNRGRLAIETVTCLLGIGICGAIAYGGWGPMLAAIEIGAYEGEGALRVPIWPVRIILVVMSALAALAYLAMLVNAWRARAPRGGTAAAE